MDYAQTANKFSVLDACHREGVRFVNLQFSDLAGIIKAVTIPFEKLENAIDQNSWFDGSSIEGFTRIYESDMFLKPDLSTFAIIPWSADSGYKTARIICDVFNADGSPFEGDPRYILKKQLAKLKNFGFDNYFTGPELEFFLFRRDEKGGIHELPHDRGSYFDQSTDLAGSIRQEMAEALEAMNIEIEQLHHEVAVGQHEINFKYSDAVTTADNAITFKYVLKAVSARHDLHATFMPKPVAGINGSGMHVHQSLFKGGQNMFFDGSDSYNLSRVAKQFIAGQLKYVREINAVINPTVNSYKRLVPGYEAPVYVCWANRNRSALIRIPRVTDGNWKAIRCELRCPDPASNPYLAFAVMLAAGLKGVEEQLEAPAPMENVNLYVMSAEERSRRGVSSLCGSLDEALDVAEKSSLLKEVLGTHTYEAYLHLKRAEADSYRMSVTPWEIENYLELY